MSTESLKSKIVEKLGRLPEAKLQTVLSFIDFLVWSTTQDIPVETASQVDFELSQEDIVNSQLEAVATVLVLKAAKEPVANPVIPLPRKGRILNLQVECNEEYIVQLLWGELLYGSCAYFVDNHPSPH